MYKNALNALKQMQRASADGYEITVTPLYRSSVDWSYVALRYPQDPHNTEPSEVLEDYKGLHWNEIADKVKALLSGTVSGFYFL